MKFILYKYITGIMAFSKMEGYLIIKTTGEEEVIMTVLL